MKFRLEYFAKNRKNVERGGTKNAYSHKTSSTNIAELFAGVIPYINRRVKDIEE